MKIYRYPPFPLAFTVDGANPNTEYDVAIINSQTDWGVTISSDSNGEIHINLPMYPFGMFDETYSVSIAATTGTFYWTDGSSDYMDDLTIVRPLFDPTSPTFDPIEEEIVRAVIDSITGGFYYTRTYFEGQGLGTDFFAIPDMIGGSTGPLTPGGVKDVMEGFVNNEHVYSKYNDAIVNQVTYMLTKDRTAIVQGSSGDRIFEAGAFKRHEHRNSDTFYFSDNTTPFFVKDWYYTFLLAGGYSSIPDDILYVADWFLNQYKTTGTIGGNDVDDYITEYSTDQFTLKMGSRAKDNNGFGSTGSKPIDAILQKYTDATPQIRRLGVL